MEMNGATQSFIVLSDEGSHSIALFTISLDNLLELTELLRVEGVFPLYCYGNTQEVTFQDDVFPNSATSQFHKRT